jgi:hypothetical protein
MDNLAFQFVKAVMNDDAPALPIQLLGKTAEDDELSAYEGGEIITKDKDQRRVQMVIVEPGEDSEGDVFDQDVIEKGYERYSKQANFVAENHKRLVDIEPLGGLVFQDDVNYCGQNLEKGTWVHDFHVTDDEQWRKIDKGLLMGASPAGAALRRPLE